MGSSEKKSMLYLECRCLYVTKGAGSQGIQNGSVSCIGVTASVPSGIREVMGENLVAALLGLECASSNDQSFSQLRYEKNRKDHAAVHAGNRFHLLRLRCRTQL